MAVFQSGRGFKSAQGGCEKFEKTSHGLAVGDVVRHGGANDTDWIKAQADTGQNSEAIGVVSEVPDANNFVVCYSGTRISGLSGLTAGCVYFLDETTAGSITLTEPNISKPVLFATSATSAVIVIMRGLDSQEGGGTPCFPDGSKAAAGVAFCDELSTGMFREPSGDLAFTVNGQEILEVQADGRVIISADTPNYTALITANNVLTNKEYVDNAVGVFGKNYNYAESEALTSTASTSFVTKAQLVTASLPLGNYRIGYTWKPGCNTNAVLAMYQVTVNGTVISSPDFEADNDHHQWAGFKKMNLSGVQTINIDYKSPNGTALTEMSHARIEIWRVP